MSVGPPPGGLSSLWAMMPKCDFCVICFTATVDHAPSSFPGPSCAHAFRLHGFETRSCVRPATSPARQSPASPPSPPPPGDIFVESEVSVGSTFTVWLPINQKGSPLRVEEGEAV